jgi:hypothetical protein
MKQKIFGPVERLSASHGFCPMEFLMYFGPPVERNKIKNFEG